MVRKERYLYEQQKIIQAELWCVLLCVQPAFGVITVDCRPIPDIVVTGGEVFEVECLLVSDVDQEIRGGQIAPLELLPGEPGSTGFVVLADCTFDPDSDGTVGRSGGPPPVTGTNGLYLNSCGGEAAFAFVPPIGTPTVTMLADTTYYAGTVRYSVSECASGVWGDGSPQIIPGNDPQIGFVEEVSRPAVDSDHTKVRDGANIVIDLDVVPYVVTVEVGTCCSGQICLTDGIDALCCAQSYPGARYFDGVQCADPLACGCTSTGDCDDGEFCTNDYCADGLCSHTPRVVLYGDVEPPGGDGDVDVDDILCVLDAFPDAQQELCPASDLEPCGGDGDVDVDDILFVLDAFRGDYSLIPCPHPCPP